MQLSVYLLDPWAQLATQAPHALIAPLFDALPALRRADWALQTGRPVTHFCQQVLASYASDNPQHANALAAWLGASIQPRPAFALVPVSLAMQRDSFSLQGVLGLSHPVYARLSAVLQQHFADDWQLLPDPQQRGWWVVPHQPVHAYSPWPADCLFQSAFAWQPQGEHAGLLRNWTNEIQMLLHGLAANEPDWPEAFNSLWFASVPELTDLQSSPNMALSGQGRCWLGVQKAIQGIIAENIELAAWLENCQQHTIQHAVWLADSADTVDWATLASWASQGFNHLQVVMPFAEQSVRVTLGPRQRWQFWRAAHNPAQLVQRLHAQLPSQRL